MFIILIPSYHQAMNYDQGTRIFLQNIYQEIFFILLVDTINFTSANISALPVKSIIAPVGFTSAHNTTPHTYSVFIWLLMQEYEWIHIVCLTNIYPAPSSCQPKMNQLCLKSNLSSGTWRMSGQNIWEKSWKNAERWLFINCCSAVRLLGAQLVLEMVQGQIDCCRLFIKMMDECNLFTSSQLEQDTWGQHHHGYTH